MSHLEIRKAKIADFDELALLFKRFGGANNHPEFFLANLIEKQGEQLRMLIALAASKIVGFMVLKRQDSLETLHAYDTASITGMGDSFVAVDMYCMDPDFEVHSSEFLYPAFVLFPSITCLLAFNIFDRKHPLFLSHFLPVTAVAISDRALYAMHKAALIPPTFRKLLIDEKPPSGCFVPAGSLGFLAEQGDNPVGFLRVSEISYQRFESLVERVEFGSARKIFILEEFDIEPSLTIYSSDFLSFALHLLEADKFITLSVLPQVPVLPCKQLRLPGLLKRDVPAEVIYSVITNKRAMVANRIVVVGASDAGLSFLESLAYSEELDYTSLTLITPVVVSWARSEYSGRDTLLNLGNVLVIKERLVSVNRKQRVIELGDGSQLPYDQLVIATGLQESTLNKLGVVSMSLPGNDSLKHVNGALSWSDPLIKKLFESGSVFSNSLRYNPISRVIIYGDGLKALVVIQQLLKGEISPEKLILVRQGTPSDISSKFTHILKQLGIEILDGLKLARFELNQEERLRACHFHEGDGKKKIKCRLIITCQDDYDVDATVFDALDSEGIVYDGRLIIDHGFKTCDPRIAACGPMAGFSLRFKKPGMSIEDAEAHSRLSGMNSIESGRLAAQAILKSGSVPQFTEPLIERGKLPHGLDYIRIFACARKKREISRKIETNTLSDDFATGCLFSIEIDRSNRIYQVTFLGRADLEVAALRSLIGLPISYLNCIVEKFDSGDIPDIFAYLAGDWALGIFHEKFSELKKSVKEGKPVRQEIEKFLENNRNTLNVYYQNN